MSHDLYDIVGGAPGLIGQVARKSAEDSKPGRTLFVASTADEDRHGDIVRQDWKLKQFRANPVILWMHDHSQAPIGRAVSAKTAKGEDSSRLMIDVEWDKSETNPLALTVSSQFASGFLSTGSVGFIPGKRTYRNQLSEDHSAYKPLGKGEPQWMHGMYLEQNLLLEFSATTIPANPNAQAVRSWAKEAGDPQEQMRRLLDETVERRVRELMLDYLRSDEEVQRSIVGLYLAEPELEPEPVVNLFDAIASRLYND